MAWDALPADGGPAGSWSTPTTTDPATTSEDFESTSDPAEDFAAGTPAKLSKEERALKDLAEATKADEAVLDQMRLLQAAGLRDEPNATAPVTAPTVHTDNLVDEFGEPLYPDTDKAVDAQSEQLETVVLPEITGAPLATDVVDARPEQLEAAVSPETTEAPLPTIDIRLAEATEAPLAPIDVHLPEATGAPLASINEEDEEEETEDSETATTEEDDEAEDDEIAAVEE
jgi:hypothetical protein